MTSPKTATSTNQNAKQRSQSNSNATGASPNYQPASNQQPNVFLLEQTRLSEYLSDDEKGDAIFFADSHRGSVVFDSSSKEYYHWEKNYWEKDETDSITRLISDDLPDRYTAAANKYSSNRNLPLLPQLPDQLRARAKKFGKASRIKNVLSLIPSREGMSINGRQWDQQPYLLAVANGVIDLKTGKLHAGNPSDYLRAHSEVPYLGITEKCDGWENFVLEIMGGNQPHADFLQRLVGLSLIGKVIAHKFPIFHGAGRNGKGTFLETISAVFGKTLVTHISPEALMISNKGGDTPRPSIVDLMGARIAIASETQAGKQFDSATVKLLTGGDTITARKLNSNNVTFSPTHSFFFSTNFLPHAPADDQAFWDRAILIPFSQRYEENHDPQKPNMHELDSYLPEKLQKEYTGILSWAIRGCLEFQKAGLQIPKEFISASKDYRNDEDQVQRFINEECEIGINYTATANELYDRYKNGYCIDQGERYMTSHLFGKKMKLKFEDGRNGQGRIIYKGLRVKP